jgi:hypothetical protein
MITQGGSLRRFVFLTACGLIGALPARALCQTSGENSGSALERMPRALETRFALSALPPAMRAHAAVYLLDPSAGYALDRAGTNGQHCLVDRTEWRPAEYRNDLYYAVCFDSVGARNQMRVLFDVAALRAKGLTAEAVKREVERRFSDGTYRAPGRAGLSYMTAPLQRTYYVNGVETVTLPHIMYYAPNVTDADIGGATPLGPYPFVMDQGPHGLFIQFLGETEVARIVAAESDLVRDLCSYRRSLCLPPKR